MRKLLLTILLLCTLAASACAEMRSYTYGGSGHDILYDAAVSADGRIVLTGATDSADGTLSSRTKTGRSGWALCIDTNGNVLWNFCTRRGSYDTLRYPVFLGNGDVAMLLETSHHGLYEVQWILLNEQGDEVARWTLESRGVPWLVRAWGVLDAYQSGYVIRCMSKKTSEEEYLVYNLHAYADEEPVRKTEPTEEPYFPSPVLPDGTRISVANSDGEYPDATVTFIPPVSQEASPESGFYTFTDNPPESLRLALQDSPLRNSSILSGCCDKLDGRWRYAQMVLKDPYGLLLCCGVYDEESGWQLEASYSALKQDTMPEMLAIAQRDGFTPDTIKAAGGCEFFEIRYPDVTLLWGYQPRWGRFVLCEATLKSGETISVSGDTFWSIPPSDYLYHDFGYSLENFALSRLPASLSEARQRAAELPQSNRNTARLSGRDSSLPQIPMYVEPNESSPTIAHYMCGVNAEVVQEGEDFALVRIGSIQGYVPRYNVLIGGERAQMEYDNSGAPGLVYGQTPQPLLVSPVADASVMAELAPASPIEILGRPAGSAYLQVRTPDGQVGFVPDTQVLIGWESFGGYFTLRVVPESGALLYSQPDESSTPIGQCMTGAQVGRLVEYDFIQGWQRVIIQGYDGYMCAEDLENVETFTVMP